MLHLLLYGVLAIVVGGVLFAVAARFLPAGEQIAPPVRDEPPWELPPDRALRADDVDAVRLPVALRGYRFAETDQLLDRLAGELRARDVELARLRGELPVDADVPGEQVAPAGEQLPFDEETVEAEAVEDELPEEVPVGELAVSEDAAQYGAVVLIKSAAALEEEARAEGDELAPDEVAPAADEIPPLADEVAPVAVGVAPAADAAPVDEPQPVDDEVVSIDELFAPIEEESAPAPLLLEPPSPDHDAADSLAAADELDESFPLPAAKQPATRRRRGRHAATPPPAAEEQAEPVAPVAPGQDDELADSLAVTEALDETAASPSTVDLPDAPADEVPGAEPPAEEPPAEEPAPAVTPPAAPPPAAHPAAAQPPAAPPSAWVPAGQQSGHWTADPPPWAVAPAPWLAQGAQPEPPPGPSGDGAPADASADQPKEPSRRARRRRRRS